MKQIQIPNEVFIKTLGYQKPASEVNYRLLAYSLLTSLPEGTLLYNSLSCEMVLLDDDDVKNMYSSNYLREHWFIVPENFPDKKFASQFRGLYKILAPSMSNISSYTILTTTDCNARCFYCYENGVPRIPMSLETADKLADYIIINYHKFVADNKTSVQLQWFGGEPLFNNKVIYHICQKLTDAEVNFKSHMISNGYLFTEKLVSDAKKLWNLKYVQITLDGTEKVYNKAKAFIHEGVNAYEHVLNNIDLLLNAHIRVVVRMNIDMYNADDLKSLALILADRFGHSKGFSCYSHPLFEISPQKAHLRSDERRMAVFNKQQELTNLLEKLNLRKYPTVPRTIATHHCMADCGTAVLISPSGNIGLCEHYSSSEFFSHVDSPDYKDKSVIKSFRETCPDIDICNDCSFYPQCIRLQKCPEGSLCFPEIKHQQIDELKKSMFVTYRRWKKKLYQGTVDVSKVSEDIDEVINTQC